MVVKGGLKVRDNIESGFTLLEILISAAILSVIVGGGISAYSRFAKRQVVVNAGSEFVVAVRDVQKRAQSGLKPAVCETAGLTLVGWRVNRNGANQYTIRAVCENSGGVESFYDEMSEQLVQGSQFTSDFDIRFAVLTGSVSGSGLNSITITDAEGSYVYRLSITSAGGINDQGVN